jgi:hypothetical protein
MISHVEARAIAIEGFRLAMATEPSRLEAIFEQGIGLLETGYGSGWHAAGIGSNNVGADQSGRPPCNPSTSFLYTDTHPNPDGSSSTYSVCFKKYPDLARGFAGLAHIMYQQMSKALDAEHNVRIAANAGDIYGVSLALYNNGYYEGFGSTPAVRVANHYRNLRADINTIALANKEKLPDGFDPLARVLKWSWSLPIPSRGEDVRRVQRVVAIDPDGWYGPKTAKAVAGFQAARPGLKSDGVTGMDTWHAIQLAERSRVDASLTS